MIDQENIRVNSTITLRPSFCDEISLDELDGRLNQLLQESKAAQQWVIDEVISQKISIKKSGKFSSADSRVLPEPFYSKDSISLSRRKEIDRSEAQRILSGWTERVEVAKLLQKYNWDVDYNDFRETEGLKWLKFNLFKNLIRQKEIPKPPKVNHPRIVTSNVDNQFLKIDSTKKEIVLTDFAILDSRYTVHFSIPHTLMEKAHRDGQFIKFSRPTIRWNKKDGMPVFDFTLIEEYSKSEVSKVSALGVDLGAVKMFSAVRVYSDGRYSEEFIASRESKKLTKRLSRINEELDLKRAKNKRREKLGITNKQAILKEKELTEKKFRIQNEQEWTLSRDIVDHSKEDETIVFENLSFNSGGSIAGKNKRFRFSPIQQKVEHSAKKIRRSVKKVKANGTTSNCPDCSGRLVIKDRVSNCGNCSWASDRDVSAAISIGKRGLEKQKMKLTPKKNKPTPKRPKRKNKKRLRTSITVETPAVATEIIDSFATSVLLTTQVSKQSYSSSSTPLRL